MNQLKVALQDAVLARCAMNGDICIVEHNQFSVFLKREIVTVDRCCSTIVQVDMPVLIPDFNNVDIIAFFVEERV